MGNISDKISVLIPTYNRREYLRECLDTIQNQIYKNLDIIIYDDGSTDGTIKMLKSLKDDRIRWTYCKKNRGVAYSRNRLLDMCKTEIACWQDSDDISNIWRIKSQLQIMEESGCDIVHTDWVSSKVIGHKWKEIWKEKPKIDVNGRAGCFPTIMFKVKKAERFLVHKITGEDTNWKSVMFKKCSVTKLYSQMYYVRWHRDRLGAQKWKK